MNISDWAALGAFAMVILNTLSSLVIKRTPSAESDRESLQKQVEAGRAIETTLRGELNAADAREQRSARWRRRTEQWIRRELRYRQSIEDSIEEENVTTRKRIWSRVTEQPPDAKDLEEETEE